MSRNFAILSKSAAPAAPIGQFHELTRLFREPAAIALIGTGLETESPLAEALAAELAASAKRVVIVPVALLLKMNPIVVPEEADFAPTSTPNVWTWPAPAFRKLEFFKTPEASTGPAGWLESLLRRFQVVLLDCPGVNEVAAMADAAVLVVEAGRTTKHQLLLDQQFLRLRGAKLLGSILIDEKRELTEPQMNADKR
jgi:hypothetical protein